MPKSNVLYEIPIEPQARWEEFPIFVTNRGTIWQDIDKERERQDEKWGPQSHKDGTGTFEQIHQAGYYRTLTDHRAEIGTLTWTDILTEEFAEALAEADPHMLRKELVQTIAVAVAWIEDLDRRNAIVPGVKIDLTI